MKVTHELPRLNLHRCDIRFSGHRTDGCRRASRSRWRSGWS